MNATIFALSVAIAALGAVTVPALLDVGYLGIFEAHLTSWAGAQVLLDLVILAVLAIVWMVRDARQRNLAAWPFVLLTLTGGSFGPLAYLLARELRGRASAPAAAAEGG